MYEKHLHHWCFPTNGVLYTYISLEYNSIAVAKSDQIILSSHLVREKELDITRY